MELEQLSTLGALLFIVVPSVMLVGYLVKDLTTELIIPIQEFTEIRTVTKDIKTIRAEVKVSNEMEEMQMEYVSNCLISELVKEIQKNGLIHIEKYDIRHNHEWYDRETSLFRAKINIVEP